MKIPSPTRRRPSPDAPADPGTGQEVAVPGGQDAQKTVEESGDNAGVDDRDAGRREERKRRWQRVLTTSLMPLVWLACIAFLVLGMPYLLTHLGLLAWIVTLLLIPVTHLLTQITRRQRATSRDRRSQQRARALLPSLIASRAPGWVDAVIYRDSDTWRWVQWAVTAATLVMSTVTPLKADPSTWKGWQTPALALGPVLLWWLVVGLHQRFITRGRRASAEAIRSIAQATLKYPRRATNMPLLTFLDYTTGYRAVKVSEWDTGAVGGPILPRRFEVIAPPELSVTDNKAWAEFEANLAAKYPRESGWHVERKANGAGAVISPAHYPTSAVWDGEYDKTDVMGYLLGESLDEPGTPQRMSLTNPSNHILVTGGTGGGKSTVVETMIAQTALKPMPWDPTLHGSAHLIDPKGPLAGRWAGRPGVICSRGDEDGFNDAGDTISGVEVMALHCELIEEEHKRRAAVLKAHPDCATWHDLPDEVKKAERLAPLLVVADEFLDHTDKELASGRDAEQIERDNAAKDRITHLIGMWERKARNVGIHIVLIAQEAKMTEIGSQRVRLAVVRVIAGQMDKFAYEGMFGTPDVPNLPTMKKTRRPDGAVVEKPIPGRCFIQMASGQKINRFQAFWFGGDQNIDTLDKWLPRDPTPGVGMFNGDAAKVMLAAMPDLDGNGVPDAWEQPELISAPSPDGAPTAPSASASTGGLFPAASGGVAPAASSVPESAKPRVALCAYEGCDKPSEYKCPRTKKGYCEAHTGGSPDPAERGRFGQDYLDSHPLNRAQAGDLYKRIGTRAARSGLVTQWQPVADESGDLTDQVRILVRTSEEKMVAEVYASPDQVQARTALARSGVQGLVASEDAVNTAIDARGGAR